MHDDGNGPALYVGGNFTIAGGVAANRIARRDGTSGSTLGGGLGDRLIHGSAAPEPRARRYLSATSSKSKAFFGSAGTILKT